jgi:hypothetical protein
MNLEVRVLAVGAASVMEASFSGIWSGTFIDPIWGTTGQLFT